MLALAGCGGSSVSSDGTAENKTGPSLERARAAIVARNFGDAVRLAHEAVTAAPRDPAAQYELARAEALAGNEGNALNALESAVAGGLSDVEGKLRDPAFDRVRQNGRFAALNARARPGAYRTDENRIAADGVVIEQRNGEDYIRAGDVSIGGNF
ncbi:hypothetical protein O6V14_05395 [Sphingomonas faeni]